jgi:hypothetical protein
MPQNKEMDKLIDTQVNNILLNTPKIENIIKI